MQEEADRLKEAEKEFRLQAKREIFEAEEKARRELDERNRQMQKLKEEEERRFRLLEEENKRKLLELERQKDIERKRKEQERLSKFLDRLKRDAQSKHLVVRGDGSPQRSPEKLIEGIHQDLEESHFAQRLEDHLQQTGSKRTVVQRLIYEAEDTALRRRVLRRSNIRVPRATGISRCFRASW